MIRTILAGLAGGVVVFFWGAVAHMFLPLGNMGLVEIEEPVQQVALQGLDAQFDRPGIYLLPMMSEAQWNDEAQAKAFGERTRELPYAFIVYEPKAGDMMERFGAHLGTQWVTDSLAGLLAAFMASLVALGRFQRALLIAGFGLFASLVVALPQWNWYRFPTDFTIAVVITQTVGWLLGGLAIAGILRPKAG